MLLRFLTRWLGGSPPSDWGERPLTTPAASHLARSKGDFADAPLTCPVPARKAETDGERWSRSEVGLELECVESSPLTDDVRGWRRVTPPLSLRISSTSCTPSGGFGFFSLIYRSKCLPRDEDVKKAWQNGQLLFLIAGTWDVLPPGSVYELGVPARTSLMTEHPQKTFVNTVYAFC